MEKLFETFMPSSVLIIFLLISIFFEAYKFFWRRKFGVYKNIDGDIIQLNCFMEGKLDILNFAADKSVYKEFKNGGKSR